ncbi:hypothetical protein GW819_01890 [Candidatus Gracilibacteria bacterium]|nr:hypothetical protein [Candidatus Gracilibacteria bacterium]OIO75639.1 MAG: hypothetical protein AUJ87_04365 [Candidatus Gracilibacteria bacterium CG1_02_38_174]PIQ11661.1 MAG: hypothetical protein COW68_02250 [Candidatus Gracilibacteria bacterium CG18_big_fil_WC_8_21_14_2_50_38_16]PIQ41443.1 MAG: hypothetical protein COW06_02885 [Candidatus Gracilibacteria bacterium CG12_big_fil_rev_8_21_14_0_65_38_15]PIZ01684.1 MAG: hypothetical protein COY60_02405 [Candidatus Gracilibacteria bacterium CG_4
MEETKNTEKKSNYIELENDSTSVGNIFNELSGELGELDFAERAKAQEVEKKHPLIIASFWTGKLFFIVVLVAILMSIDIFVRTMKDNSYFANLPICPYLSYGVDNYENNNCKTLPQIFTELKDQKDKLEKNIVANLIILVPKFLQSSDISSSPKVQFIQEHTGDSRISITDAITRFLEIKNRTSYQGEDIECKGVSANEQGQISLSCEIYGGPIISPTGQATKTSREIALAFLNRLGDTSSNFQILSYPKVLDISEFNSVDGFKSVFSTVTPLDLKLQYLPTNKM